MKAENKKANWRHYSGLIILFAVFTGCYFLFSRMQTDADKIDVVSAKTKRRAAQVERVPANSDNRIMFGDDLPDRDAVTYRYTHRLRDTNMQLYALIVTVIHETLKNKGRQPADLQTVFDLAKAKQVNGASLWMNHWQVSGNDIFTDNGRSMIYYRPEPLALEIRNISYRDGDQVILMRIPEFDGSPVISSVNEQNSQVSGVLLMLSPAGNAAVFPPFTPKEMYLQSNWKQEYLKISLSDTAAADQMIKRWANEQIASH